MSVFKAPELKDGLGVSFTPISLSYSIAWAINYNNNLNILTKEMGHEGCFEFLTKEQKAGLLTHNTLVSLAYNGFSQNQKSLLDADNIKELGLMYPYIAKLADLDIIIAVAPICVHGGRVHNMQTRKIRSEIRNSTEMILAQEDIDILQEEINLDRKVIVYTLQPTPLMYNPATYEEIKGMMLRYVRYQPN